MQLALHAEQLAMCMLFGLPGFIQEAAITALAHAPEAEARIRQLCAARRERLLQGVMPIRQLRPLAPEAGMFMLLDVIGHGPLGDAVRTRVLCLAACLGHGWCGVRRRHGHLRAGVFRNR